MLVRKDTKPQIVRRFFILLSFISFVTFQTDVLAAPKQNLYEKYRDLGYQEQQKGNFSDALTYFSKAVSLGNKDPVVFNDMGIIYEQLGYLGKAEQYYGKALTIDPEYLPAYSNIAYLYLNNGFPEKAFPYFKKRHELSTLGDDWGERAKEEMLKIN
ncbi:MAG: tetratricopeptide repeat protein, partial [Candidatus Omnitrophica bacterium]|nr:tetratricopeptide repeat protein [Candidatus Omnitrophota bacterium]